MLQSISRTLVVVTLVAAAALYADDPKCNATARACELQIRQMLTGRRYFGASVEDTRPGVVVKTVKEGSPAERAGLRPGDRLIALNGKSLTQSSSKEYKQVLLDARETGRVWMIIGRRGVYKKLETRLEPLTKEQIAKIIASHLSQSHATSTAGAQ